MGGGQFSPHSECTKWFWHKRPPGVVFECPCEREHKYAALPLKIMSGCGSAHLRAVPYSQRQHIHSGTRQAYSTHAHMQNRAVRYRNGFYSFPAGRNTHHTQHASRTHSTHSNDQLNVIHIFFCLWSAHSLYTKTTKQEEEKWKKYMRTLSLLQREKGCPLLLIIFYVLSGKSVHCVQAGSRSGASEHHIQSWTLWWATIRKIKWVQSPWDWCEQQAMCHL